jgi:NADP-dependent 3-hydroxy acid dehydrogenase YdfG
MIAIVTGATGDIGKEFISKLYGEVDNIWAVGRSEEKLSELAEFYGEKIIPVKADLSDKEQILSLCRKIWRAEMRRMLKINQVLRLAYKDKEAYNDSIRDGGVQYGIFR